MPKIRLSALVTDMKGKSGGSVFSTNNGGTYFRNNKSGGGIKSAIAQTQKALFSSVSNFWKSLTPDQQEAWTAAVVNYPTLNAFGEPRKQSGYELFMRLNSNLISSGFPILSVPSIPRTAPAISIFEIHQPEEYQFTPFRIPFFPDNYFSDPVSISNGSQCSEDADCNAGEMCIDNVCQKVNYSFGIQLQKAFETTGSSNSNTLSVRFICNDLQNQKFQQAGSISYLLGQDIAYGSLLNIRVLGLGNGDATIQVLMANDDILDKKTTVISYTVPVSSLLNSFHFAFIFDVDSPATNRIAINGFPIDMDTIDCILTWAAAGDYTLSPDYSGPCDLTAFPGWNEPTFFVNPIELGPQGIVPSDYRYFQSALGFLDLQKLSKGYVLGSEYTCIPLDYVVNGEYPWALVDNGVKFAGIGQLFTVDTLAAKTSFPVSERYLRNNSVSYSPAVAIEPDAIVDNGFVINLFSSRYIGLGKGRKSATLVKIATTPFNSIAITDISADFAALNPNVIGDTQSFIEGKVLDSTTGLQYDYAILCKKPKNVARFKAGAELSGKVN